MSAVDAGSVEVLTGLHRPDTPCGCCVLCGLAWPCPVERDRLVARYRYGSPQLGERAFEMLEAAVADDPDRPQAELWRRFIAWTGRDWAAARFAAEIPLEPLAAEPVHVLDAVWRHSGGRFPDILGMVGAGE